MGKPEDSQNLVDPALLISGVWPSTMPDLQIEVPDQLSETAVEPQAAGAQPGLTSVPLLSAFPVAAGQGLPGLAPRVLPNPQGQSYLSEGAVVQLIQDLNTNWAQQFNQLKGQVESVLFLLSLLYKKL